MLTWRWCRRTHCKEQLRKEALAAVSPKVWRSRWRRAAAAELDVPAAVLKAELIRVLLEVEDVLKVRAAERNDPAPPAPCRALSTRPSACYPSSVSRNLT